MPEILKAPRRFEEEPRPRAILVAWYGPPSMTGPEQPEPFLRGCAFPAAPGVPYPRAKNDDRLPRDTWAMASIPVGVRLEFLGDATQVEIAYETATDDLGYRGDGAGRAFTLWRGGRPRRPPPPAPRPRPAPPPP